MAMSDWRGCMKHRRPRLFHTAGGNPFCISPFEWLAKLRTGRVRETGKMRDLIIT